MSELKRRNWAHEIYAGNSGQGHEENGFTTEFMINIRLTDDGLINWKSVIGIIFEYIRLLNEIPKDEEIRIFKEIQKIENLNWISKEETNPFDYVELVAESN